MAFQGVEVRSDGSLYCDISVESLGFPSYTPLCALPIRYNGEKFREMGELFVTYARSTCPVDTGYLRDHNDFSADLGGVEMWSEAFYSVYQEYGTSRCRAQPWFESSIQSALADSGIMDDFESTQARFNAIDGELMAVQTAYPTTIAECWSLIARIENLQGELASIGIYLEGLQESLDQLQFRIDMMAQQMMMEAMLGGKGVMDMSFIEQMIISLISGFIGIIIRSIIEGIFENSKDADANPHNPSH